MKVEALDEFLAEGYTPTAVAEVVQTR